MERPLCWDIYSHSADILHGYCAFLQRWLRQKHYMVNASWRRQWLKYYEAVLSVTIYYISCLLMVSQHERIGIREFQVRWLTEWPLVSWPLLDLDLAVTLTLKMDLTMNSLRCIELINWPQDDCIEPGEYKSSVRSHWAEPNMHWTGCPLIQKKWIQSKWMRSVYPIVNGQSRSGRRLSSVNSMYNGFFSINQGAWAGH